MVYEPLYHALGRVCSKLKQAENRLYLQIKSGRIFDIFNETIIPIAFVGYGMSQLCTSNTPRWISQPHPISNAHSWNSC